jgi:hypothetical protein
MPTLQEDPLYQAQYQAALDILGLYNPAQEAERKDLALGSLKQTVAERQARAGLTGSSEEKDALTNAASRFELDWADRKPTQISKAITASQLPIGNLLTGNSQALEKSRQDYLKLQGLAQGSASLANWLLADGAKNLRDLAGGTAGGAKKIYDALFGGGASGSGTTGGQEAASALPTLQQLAEAGILDTAGTTFANTALDYGIGQTGTDWTSWLTDTLGGATNTPLDYTQTVVDALPSWFDWIIG